MSPWRPCCNRSTLRRIWARSRAGKRSKSPMADGHADDMAVPEHHWRPSSIRGSELCQPRPHFVKRDDDRAGLEHGHPEILRDDEGAFVDLEFPFAIAGSQAEQFTHFLLRCFE